MTPGYQHGDKTMRVGGRDVRLRLTLGALAECCDHLGVDSLANLAARLASPTSRDLALLVQACLRPVHGHSAQGLALALAPERAAPLLGELFEEAFS